MSAESIPTATGAVDMSSWQGPIRDRSGSLGKPRRAIQSRTGFFQRLHPAEMSESADLSGPSRAKMAVHDLGITLDNRDEYLPDQSRVILAIVMTIAKASELTEPNDLGRFHSNVHCPHTP